MRINGMRMKKIFSQKFKFLAVIAMAVLFYCFYKQYASYSVKLPLAPYHKEIKHIMESLDYSGIEMFLRPQVRLILDIRNRVWILNNVYFYSENGGIILEKDRFGTCGELAVYMADKIRPILGNNYAITFARSSHSAYFLSDNSAHIVLKIYDKNLRGPRGIYVLDPSFKKYGHMSNFENYNFFEEMKELEYIKKTDKNAVFSINCAMPLLIKKEFIVGFTVEPVAGIFDENNFCLALTATKKYHYAGRYIAAFRKYNGNEEFLFNEILGEYILSKRQYNAIKVRIKELFKGIKIVV
jgi:hypothetical protein